MAEKGIKRKAEKTGKEEAVKKIKEAKTAEIYEAGGLSSLFGKSNEGADVVVDVVQGSSVIEKPKRRLNEKKEEEEGKEKKDRTKQRENRLKRKQNSEAISNDNASTIFVGNLPLTTTEKMVRRIFSTYGTIESVRMRGLIAPNEKTTKRLAHLTGKFSENQKSLTFYVKFKDEKSVEKALKYNGTIREGHTIRVDKCGVKKEFSKDFAIFVGNVAFDATEDDIHKLFAEKVGPVEAVRIVRDKTTGIGKGFAFVNFKEDSSASLALSMETIKMGDRELRITKVMKKGKLNKIEAAKKRSGGAKTSAKIDNKIEGKMENFKFSTKKPRTDEQNERRALKKSAKKAIMKKKASKRKSLMQ